MGLYINGQESKGPYGYLCLGLSYGWNNKKRILVLEKLILVKLDLKLKMCIEMPLYYDRFEYANEITENDGKYYCQNCQIVNFDMLEIPDKLDDVIVEEDFWGKEKRTYINSKGRTKYSVNRVCRSQPTSFSDTYTELYACVIDFDKGSLQGTLVGFDCLGKILKRNFDLKSLIRVQEIRQTLLKDMVLFDLKYDEEDEARNDECGMLNFDFFLDKKGGIIFEYNSIWD